MRMPHSWDDATLPGGPPVADAEVGTPSLDAPTLPHIRTPEERAEPATQPPNGNASERPKRVSSVPPPPPSAFPPKGAPAVPPPAVNLAAMTAHGEATDVNQVLPEARPNDPSKRTSSRPPLPPVPSNLPSRSTAPSVPSVPSLPSFGSVPPGSNADVGVQLARLHAQSLATRTTLDRQVRETTQLRGKLERTEEKLKELDEDRDDPRTLAELVRMRVRLNDLEALGKRVFSDVDYLRTELERIKELRQSEEIERSRAELDSRAEMTVSLEKERKAREEVERSLRARDEAIGRERTELAIVRQRLETMTTAIEAQEKRIVEYERRAQDHEGRVAEHARKMEQNVLMISQAYAESGTTSELMSLQKGFTELRTAIELQRTRERAPAPEIVHLAGRLAELEQLAHSLHDGEKDVRAAIKRLEGISSERKATSSEPPRGANEELVRLAGTIREESERFEKRAVELEQQLEDHADQMSDVHGRLGAQAERLAIVERAVQDLATPAPSMTSMSMGGDNEGEDDLRRIPGIGPAFERRLHALGIRTYKQVAEWRTAEVAQVAAGLGVPAERIMKGRWIEHARKEHARKYGKPID